jgi:hypothetical protein
LKERRERHSSKSRKIFLGRGDFFFLKCCVNKIYMWIKRKKLPLLKRKSNLKEKNLWEAGSFLYIWHSKMKNMS